MWGTLHDSYSIVVKDRGHIFRGELVRCIGYQETSFADSTVANHHASGERQLAICSRCQTMARGQAFDISPTQTHSNSKPEDDLLDGSNNHICGLPFKSLQGSLAKSTYYRTRQAAVAATNKAALFLVATNERCRGSSGPWS